MWKALLIVFVTSAEAPVESMAVEFPAAFASEADCRAFLASNTADTLGTIAEIGKKHGIEILGSATDCVKAAGGIGI